MQTSESILIILIPYFSASPICLKCSGKTYVLLLIDISDVSLMWCRTVFDFLGMIKKIVKNLFNKLLICRCWSVVMVNQPCHVFVCRLLHCPWVHNVSSVLLRIRRFLRLVLFLLVLLFRHVWWEIDNEMLIYCLLCLSEGFMSYGITTSYHNNLYT